MHSITKTTLKTFFYNLIFFDFIFLSPLTRKVSNFYLNKISFLKHKYLFRLSIFELLKGFKLFIRLFSFLANQLRTKMAKKKLFLHLWCHNSYDIQFLQFFFNKYKLKIPLEISFLFPQISNKFSHLNSVLVLDQSLNSNDYKNFFFRNIHLIQKIGISEDFKNWGSFKIHNSLNTKKKLLLIGLILIQIFKK